MGPDENSTAGVLYFKTEYHDYVQIPSNILPFLELECDDEEAYKRALTIRNSDSFIFTIHLRKDRNRMSGKRFKKILMAKGFSRDDADFLYYLVGWLNGKVCYCDIYWNVLLLNPSVTYYEVFNYIMTKGEISEWTNIKQQMSLI